MGGSKFGFAEVWTMFGLILAEQCSKFRLLGVFASAKFDFWVMNLGLAGSKYDIFGFVHHYCAVYYPPPSIPQKGMASSPYKSISHRQSKSAKLTTS